jgi:hypothetical protein
MHKQHIEIYVPMYYKLCVLKQNNIIIIYAYNNINYISLSFTKEKIRFCKNTKGLQNIISNLKTKQNINFIEYFCNTIIKSWSIFFFKKFKFKSKGLKIKRRRKKNLRFLFWLSHIHAAKIKNCKLRRIGKQKYMFICTNWIYLSFICKTMQKIRPNDLFTKKGIRLGRQIILKKRGKKISFI